MRRKCASDDGQRVKYLIRGRKTRMQSGGFGGDNPVKAVSGSGRLQRVCVGVQVRRVGLRPLHRGRANRRLHPRAIRQSSMHELSRLRPARAVFRASPEPFAVHQGVPSIDLSIRRSFLGRTDADTLASVLRIGPASTFPEGAKEIEVYTYRYGGAETDTGDPRIHEVRLCGELRVSRPAVLRPARACRERAEVHHRLRRLAVRGPQRPRSPAVRLR